MEAFLKQQDLWAPLSKNMKSDVVRMVTLEQKAHSMIVLCLVDEVIIEVSGETTTTGL